MIFWPISDKPFTRCKFNKFRASFAFFSVIISLSILISKFGSSHCWHLLFKGSWIVWMKSNQVMLAINAGLFAQAVFPQRFALYRKSVYEAEQLNHGNNASDPVLHVPSRATGRSRLPPSGPYARPDGCIG